MPPPYPDLPAHYKILGTIKDAPSTAYTTKYSVDPTETHLEALIPLSHLSSNPTPGQSGARFFIYMVRLRWSNFQERMFDQTDEPNLHAAPRDTEEVGVDDDKVEILESLVGQRSRRVAPESAPAW